MTENCLGINEWSSVICLRALLHAGTYGPCTGPGGLGGLDTNQPGPSPTPLQTSHTLTQIPQVGGEAPVSADPPLPPSLLKQPRARLTHWESTVPSRYLPALGAKEMPQNFEQTYLLSRVLEKSYILFNPQAHVFDISRQFQKKVILEKYIW